VWKNKRDLDELFTQVLAALSKEGLITLEQVMQDGTKIKAQTSTRSYRQEEVIRGHLEKATRPLTRTVPVEPRFGVGCISRHAYYF
jgi:hypothetical protein